MNLGSTNVAARRWFWERSNLLFSWRKSSLVKNCTPWDGLEINSSFKVEMYGIIRLRLTSASALKMAVASAVGLSSGIAIFRVSCSY